MIRIDQLQEIAALSPPILSAYLNIQAENASRHPRVQACLTWFKKEAISMSPGLLPRDAERLERQVERVEKFLDQRHPAEKALAIFAGRDNWTVLPIQVSVENELSWGKPAVGQLFRLLSEHPPSCIVVVDHHAARFFVYSLGELVLFDEKAFDVDISQWKKKDLGHFAGERIRKTRGSQRDVFEHRLEARYGRLCRETAERAAALCEHHGLTSIFLVGADRLIGLMKIDIPQALAEFVFLVPEDLGNFSPKDVLRRLEPLIGDCRHTQQMTAVKHLLGADRGAVTDVDETLTKLQNGAIRTFVLAWDLDLDLHQCVKCSWVSRTADPVCPTCGAQRRKVALSEILPALLATHDTKLEVVSGDAARMLARAGGMGGWLRQARRTAAG
jgi:hypothetical protein